MRLEETLALTPTLSPRRGNRECPRWKESLNADYSEALEYFFLSRRRGSG